MVQGAEQSIGRVACSKSRLTDAAPTGPAGGQDPAGVVVVIPTYNERENLPICIERVMAPGPCFRVIVVDDQSPDGTGAIADELAATYPGRSKVLHRPVMEGLGPACLAGFRAALRSGGGGDNGRRPLA